MQINYIHIALMIGIVICLLLVRWKSMVKEGFDDGETLIYTSAQCPLFSTQMKGFMEAKEAATAANEFSSVGMYTHMITELQKKMTAAGCTGEEEGAKVPAALPSTMSSADIEAAQASPPVIDLVPNSGTVAIVSS
jgi:hypothetical protein